MVRPIRLISIVEPRRIVRSTVVVRDRPLINLISPPIKLSDQPYQDGEFLLLDFGEKRQVQSVQIVGRSDSPQPQLDLKLRA